MGLWDLLCSPQRGSVVVPEARTQICEQQEKPISKLRVVLSSSDAAGPISPQGRTPRRPLEAGSGWSIGATKISSSPIDTAIIEGEELLAKAAVPDASWSLPVVSLASLEAAFKHAPQAVAVVKLSHQPTTPRCSTAGLAFSTPASPKASRPQQPQQQPSQTQAHGVFGIHSSQQSFSSSDGMMTSGSSSTGGGILNAMILNKRMSAAHRLVRMPSSRRCSFAVHAAPQPAELAREPAAATVQWGIDEKELQERGAQPSTCPTRPVSRFGSVLSRPTSAHARRGSEEPGAQLAQLEPVFLNEPLNKMLGIKRLDEYAHIMDRQLLRNPMMVMLFENSVRRLLAGKATSVRQYIPHFQSDRTSGSSSSSGRGADHSSTTFINLCITACALKEDHEEGGNRSSSGGGSAFSDDSAESAGVSSATPALFLWYDLPKSQAELTSQLKRDYMALSHIPSMVSVLTFDGRVLHQNGCSVAYMGFLMNTRFSRPAHIQDKAHTLQRLFVLDPDALEDMLDTLADNKTWHGLVKMPAHLDLTEPLTPGATSFSGSAAEAGQLEAGTPRGSSSPSRFGPRSTNSSTRTTREEVGAAGTSSSSSSSARSTREDAPVCGLGLGSAPASARCTAEDLTALCSISEHDSASPTAIAAAAAAAAACQGGTSSTGGLSSSTGGPRSWGSSARTTRQTISSGGVSPQIQAKQRRTSWHLPGKPFLEACQRIVLGNRAGSLGGGPSSPAELRAKQAASTRSSRVVQLARESQEAVLQQAAAMAADEGAGAAEEPRWHQVQASKFQDPVTGQDVIMFIQTDASARVRAEELLGHVLDAEHALLEEVFPRQVLETMTAAAIRSSLAKGLVSTASDVDRHPLLLAQNAQNTRTIATHHEQVSIMFADIVGFTTMAKHVEPVTVMTFLNDLYTKFDALLGEHSVYKVETIGDCYMVAGGLVFTDAQGYTSVMQSKVDPLHAKRVFTFAQGMLRVAAQVNMPDTGVPVRLRVGIHSGPVVSGVVGTRMPRFCLFGDTVNTANRMESTASPNSIHVSDATQSLIGGDCWEATGGVQLKGRGMMESFTYWPDRQAVASETPAAAAAPEAAVATAASAPAVKAAPTQVATAPAAAVPTAAAAVVAPYAAAVPGAAAKGVRKSNGR